MAICASILLITIDDQRYILAFIFQGHNPWPQFLFSPSSPSTSPFPCSEFFCFLFFFCGICNFYMKKKCFIYGRFIEVAIHKGSKRLDRSATSFTFVYFYSNDCHQSDIYAVCWRCSAFLK